MRKKETMSAFLGEGAEFEGKLKFRGILRIDGRFKGGIVEGSTLFIGDKAVIKGDIHANHVVLTGEIHGNIIADERVEVHPPGKVFGSIQARTALIDEGAVFVGNCRILRPKEAAEAPEQSPKGDALARDDKSSRTAIKPVEIKSPVAPKKAVIAGPEHGNPIEHFFEDCCKVSPEGQVQAQPFYQAYRKWCESNDKPPLTAVQFGKMMTKKFEKVDLSGKRFYKGIRLTIDSQES